jgi:signal transduction histidine kinase
MNIETHNSLIALFQSAAAHPDWKSALDAMTMELRPFIVFDNIAIYLADPKTHTLEVAYARALGRGKSAEADAAWGDRVAAEILAHGQIVHQTPLSKPKTKTKTKTDRLSLSHLLGLPLHENSSVNGAVVFVRFGGPEFAEDHIQVGALAAMWMSRLFERRAWQETYRQLDEVQRRIRLQDDFLATVSHELRTPLGFIKGYSTTLLRQDTSWDEKTQREFLTIIEEEADHLARLIEDLLESARLQSNTIQFKFQPMRMDALIRDVVLRINQRHPGLSVKLDFDAVPPIPGDTIHLTRVFENLFSNAIKYAPDSPLEVGMIQTDSNLHVRFSDYGPGIPVEHQAMIFERFYRVPGKNAVSTGTGLGLYICSQIIMAHHGKIWVESTPGQGTTFHIELPLTVSPDPGT